jgi:arylsulfatase
MFNAYSGMDIGRDNGEVVDPVYADRAPFAFTGRIHRVDFDVRQPGAQEQAALHHAETAGQHARHIES